MCSLLFRTLVIFYLSITISSEILYHCVKTLTVSSFTTPNDSFSGASIVSSSTMFLETLLEVFFVEIQRSWTLLASAVVDFEVIKDGESSFHDFLVLLASAVVDVVEFHLFESFFPFFSSLV